VKGELTHDGTVMVAVKTFGDPVVRVYFCGPNRETAQGVGGGGGGGGAAQRRELEEAVAVRTW
jgi:hypothetical protein